MTTTPAPDGLPTTTRRRGMPGPARRGWRKAFTRRRLVTTGVILALTGGLVTWIVWPDGQPVRAESAFVTVNSGPGRDEPIRLDTTIFVPDSATADDPAPAVLVAHGFGGSKATVAADARELAQQGYVVLTWSARGFGQSAGQISLDHPDYEVNDARGLVDLLARRPDVQKDAEGDPRLGVVGGSYGGGLALLLAGHDQRVDAIVPQITWHDLAGAFFPEARGAGPEQGVFKRTWAGLFFGTGSGLSVASLLGPGAPSRAGLDPQRAQCGRFRADVCKAYLEVATTGRASAESVALLRRSSPAPVLGRIKAPTLLVQGQGDTLFPLSEAEANARGIAAAGTPVRVAWYSGGHDGAGSNSDIDRVKFLTLQWLDHYLAGKGPAPATSFTFSTSGGISVRSSRPTTITYATDRYPGLTGDTAPTRIDLEGPPQPVANPPAGTPAALSSLPGVSGLTALVGGVSLDVPGQFAAFQSPVLDEPLTVVGAPTVSIKAASPTGEAVLFVKLYDVNADGRPLLPSGLVAPVRLTGLPATLAEARPVTVTLPALAYRFETGHRLRV
ncbi:MAG TPA: alpha/beta fold hydrolase, partial [Cryptosporangiaceae bacterium]|nr:alpha/beta fold hydrolase [Cryptosporangiaceae bacterium]